MKILNSNGASQNNSKGYEVVAKINVERVDIKEVRDIHFVVNKKIDDFSEMFIVIDDYNASSIPSMPNMIIGYDVENYCFNRNIPMIFFKRESNPVNTSSYVMHGSPNTSVGNWKMGIPYDLQTNNSFTIVLTLTGGSSYPMICYGFIAVQ